MKNKIRFICFCLILAIICLPFNLLAGPDGSPDGYDSWDDFLLGIQSDSGSGETASVSRYYPSVTEMTLVDKTDDIEFYFYQEDMALFVRDTKTGKLWSNILNDAVTGKDKTDFDSRGLLEVNIADKDNSVTAHNILSSKDMNGGLTAAVDGKTVNMKVEISDSGIAFDIIFGIEDASQIRD